MNNVTHHDIFNHIEQWAPKHLAYDWDAIGLQVGAYDDPTKKVLVSLDVTDAVVKEAIEHQVDLIIAHHPLLFKPMQSIDVQSAKGKMIAALLKHDITVYAAHTNLDIAPGGVNDLLSAQLQLKNKHHLLKVYNEKLFKVIVYVPNDHVNQVRNALGDAGAGHIGQYSHCTFQTAGVGTFKPLEGSNPFIGKQDEISYVEEQKLETIVNEKNLTNVIQQMKKAHPYEEAAYDVYPLQREGSSYGLGRVGSLAKPMSLHDFCEHVKACFQLEHLRFVGDPKRKIEKVAILGGSGEKYIEVAMKQGADVFITGDISFHVAQDADEMGLALIDPGHYVEEIMKNQMKQYIQHTFPSVNVIASSAETDPFQFL